MNLSKSIKNSSNTDYSLSLSAFCLPMIVFCLLVSWGIEILAKELFLLM